MGSDDSAQPQSVPAHWQQLVRSSATFVGRWRGAEARLHEFTVSLRYLTIVGFARAQVRSC